MEADARAELSPPQPYDLTETLRLVRTGGRDPSVVRHPGGLTAATHTPGGPATVRIDGSDPILVRAWGPGAPWAVQHAHRLLGLHEAPWKLPAHPVIDRLHRNHRGLRLVDTGNLYEGLLVTVLQQLVTWNEAAMAWRRLLEVYGAPAPGPIPGMRVPPRPAILLRAGAARVEELGIGAKRARTLLMVAYHARQLPRIAEASTAVAYRQLVQIQGIGPWTAASVLGMRLGRPEPVVLGDYHLPNTVAYALAGEPRGTEARMLELLRPFKGQVFRVLRLIHAAGIHAPRYGPKRPFTSHRR